MLNERDEHTVRRNDYREQYENTDACPRLQNDVVVLIMCSDVEGKGKYSGFRYISPAVNNQNTRHG